MEKSKPDAQISTKISPPRRGLGLIPRPQLQGLMTQVQARRLAVLKAPAGFGKTSVAMAWCEQLLGQGQVVAWITLDEDDDEPVRFLYNLAQAIERARPGTGAAAINLIAERSLIPSHTVIAALVNSLAELDEEFYLFVDDYHCLQRSEIHDAMAFFLRYAPANCHVVITTRSDPPLPVARLRAQDDVLEVDTAGLRFNLEETQRLFAQDSVSRLDLAGVRALLATTEGWIAALRISSLALRSAENPDAYVRNLSGRSRPIGDYLAELMKQLPAEMQRFMMSISFLERTCAALCQAVTGLESSAEMLLSIEQHQLLLARLDDTRTWFAFHRLFADYLHQRARAELGGQMTELYRRAYRWFASQGLWVDAVKYALAADDTDEAARLVGNCAMALVKKGDLLTLLGWERRLPPELMRGQLRLRLAIAWAMTLAIRLGEAHALVEEMDGELLDSPDVVAIRWECQALRFTIAGLADDTAWIMANAERWVAQPSRDPWVSNAVSNALAYARLKSGLLAACYATTWIPYTPGEDARNFMTSIYRLCILGLAEMQQAHLDASDRHYREAGRIAAQKVGHGSVAAALPASMAAQLRYEEGRFDAAEELVADRMELIEATGFLDCVLSTYTVLARIALSRANPEKAYALLDQAESIGHARDWPRMLAAVLVERLRLYLHEGRLMEGMACVARLAELAARHPAPQRCAWTDIHQHAALARAYLALAQNQWVEAVQILSELLNEALGSQNQYFAIRLGATLAVAQLAGNQNEPALDTLGRTLHLAAPAGALRSIIDAGPEIGTLLDRLQPVVRKTAQAETVCAHLARLRSAWREAWRPAVATAPAAGLRDPLSPREKNILELIALGRSNKEIARSLGVTPETVKSHLKNIFIKLNVEKRAQAVVRAQTLGLLAP